MLKRTRHLPRLAAVVLVFLGTLHGASAWLRYYAPDDELVQQSDAIVVGHVEASFLPLELVNRQGGRPDGYHFWEYRTTLVVTGSLAGKVQVGPTPLLIHYGIRPVVLKTKPTIQDTFNPPAADQSTNPSTPVGIFDGATTCIGGPPTDDIRKDHVWFLRTKRQSIGPVEEITDAPGIWSPQDVQPVESRDYYVAVLSGDPNALAPYVTGDTRQAKRALDCQQRLIVQQIAKNPDVGRRADALVAFVTASGGSYSSANALAMDQLVMCGPIGAAKLLPLFAASSALPYQRGAILGVWNKTEYKPAVPVITDWLRNENQAWSNRSVKDQVWAMTEGFRGGPADSDPRVISYGELLGAVQTLGNLGGSQARDVIGQVRARWAAANFHPENTGNDLVRACDEALASFK